MPREPLPVGTRVVVYDHFSQPVREQQVARALKRYIELDDGSRWCPDGEKPYPKPSSMMHRWLEVASVRALEDLRRRRMCERLRRTKWEELSTPELRSVCELLGMDR